MFPTSAVSLLIVIVYSNIISGLDRNWSEVLSCLDKSVSDCQRKSYCFYTNNYQQNLACWRNFTTNAHISTVACLGPDFKFNKCFGYNEHLDEYNIEAIRNTEAKATWHCMNERCGSLSDCSFICIPNTADIQQGRDNFTPCYEAKMKKPIEDLLQCFINAQ